MADLSASFDPALVATNSDAASSALAEANAASATAAAASSAIAAQSAAWETTISLATASEINTGTEASKAVTPDALAGSNLGTKNVVIKCIADGTTLTTGDGKAHFTIPVELNGMNLISVGAHVYTVSSSGTPTFQVHNLTDAVDMLSTLLTIDANEKDSKDATTPAVINGANDDVATGDELRFDCDVAGTGTKGMEIRLGFRLP